MMRKSEEQVVISATNDELPFRTTRQGNHDQSRSHRRFTRNRINVKLTLTIVEDD